MPIVHMPRRPRRPSILDFGRGVSVGCDPQDQTLETPGAYNDVRSLNSRARK